MRLGQAPGFREDLRAAGRGLEQGWAPFPEVGQMTNTVGSHPHRAPRHRSWTAVPPSSPAKGTLCSTEYSYKTLGYQVLKWKQSLIFHTFCPNSARRDGCIPPVSREDPYYSMGQGPDPLGRHSDSWMLWGWTLRRWLRKWTLSPAEF